VLLDGNPVARLVEARQQLLDRGLRVAAAAPQLHEARVDDDPMEPRREARGSLEPRDRPKGRDERPLDGVPGRLLVAPVATSDREHPSRVLAHEDLVGRVVSAPQALEERGLRAGNGGHGLAAHDRVSSSIAVTYAELDRIGIRRATRLRSRLAPSASTKLTPER